MAVKRETHPNYFYFCPGPPLDFKISIFTMRWGPTELRTGQEIRSNPEFPYGPTVFTRYYREIWVFELTFVAWMFTILSYFGRSLEHYGLFGIRLFDIQVLLKNTGSFVLRKVLGYITYENEFSTLCILADLVFLKIFVNIICTF